MKNIMFEKKNVPFSFGITKSLSPTPHFHKDFEIVYVLNGYSNIYVDQKKDVIETGDLFISFPNQIHYYEGSKIGAYLLAIFSPDILYDLKDTVYDAVPNINILRQTQKREYSQLLLRALQTSGAYQQTIKSGILNQAMGMILPEFELKSLGKTNNSTLQEVLSYCSSNFAEDITLDDVAKALHISKFHISHLLNERLGLSFVTYLNTLRIHNACDLMADTDKKMAQISEDVGFGSIRSFNRAFQSTMNMSPSDYRKQLKPDISSR